MKAVLFCILIGCGIFCRTSSTDDVLNSAHSIQIVSPINHTFHLNLSDFKQILEDGKIKDRFIMVVSIVGAFRQGKSFLMSLFLKYLYAEVRQINVGQNLN